MPAGRPRKPTALKLIHGSRDRHNNKNEPKPTGTATMPEWLKNLTGQRTGGPPNKDIRTRTPRFISGWLDSLKQGIDKMKIKFDTSKINFNNLTENAKGWLNGIKNNISNVSDTWTKQTKGIVDKVKDFTKGGGGGKWATKMGVK